MMCAYRLRWCVRHIIRLEGSRKSNLMVNEMQIRAYITVNGAVDFLNKLDICNNELIEHSFSLDFGQERTIIFFCFGLSQRQ